MNIVVHVSFRIGVLFSSDIYSGVALLDCMVVLFSFFWGNSILFSTVAASVYIPINSVQGFTFLQILTNICYLWSFWWQPFCLVWGSISLWFWFAFLWLMMLSIFSFACWSSVCRLWKNVYSGLPSIFLNRVVYFFDVELYELFIVVGYNQQLISHIICKFFTIQ